MLLLLLAAILAFRDKIGSGAQTFIDAVSAPDIVVEVPVQTPTEPTSDVGASEP